MLETNRAEQSQSHVHRMYFMGPNTFSEPWHLSHIPPEEIKEIVLVVSSFLPGLLRIVFHCFVYSYLNKLPCAYIFLVLVL